MKALGLTRCMIRAVVFEAREKAKAHGCMCPVLPVPHGAWRTAAMLLRILLQVSTRFVCGVRTSMGLSSTLTRLHVLLCFYTLGPRRQTIQASCAVWPTLCGRFKHHCRCCGAWVVDIANVVNMLCYAPAHSTVQCMAVTHCMTRWP